MAVIEARIKGFPNPELTLDEVANEATESTRSRMDDVEVLDEQDVTLESGEPAHVIQFRYDNPNDGAGILRSTYLVTLASDLMYKLEFAKEETAYTEADEELVDAVISSYALTGS